MDRPFCADPDFVERRRVRRAACAVEVTVRQRGRFAVAARLADLTTEGCRMEGAGPFTPDSELWIRLPGLESQIGRVAWSSGGDSGGRFEQPLHPAVAARFLPAASRLEVVRSDPPPGTAPMPPDTAALSRRDQILRGLAESDQGPLKRRKAREGAGLMGTIKRQVARRADHRHEDRYSDAVRTGPMALTVAALDAAVGNVSASGLKLRVALQAEIGASVPVEFPGFPPLAGKVVWLRPGEVGLSLPPQSIALADE